MDSKKIGQTAFVAIGLLFGVYTATAILLNPTGGISGLSKLVTAGGILLGLINPRAGLFFLAAQAIYSDELKRIGVYYGVASTQTISEILAGPLLTICAINASFLYGVIQSRYRIGKLGVGLYAVIPVIAIGIYLSNRASGDLKLTVYLAGTASLYLSLIPVCFGLFRTFEDWTRFISWQVILAAPAAAWGIWQYFHGFNDIEWTYAQSWLSRVHSNQMLNFENPRIFGFFGSESAMGCAGMYGVFAIWHAFRFQKGRFLHFTIAAIYLVAIVLSQQRSMLLYPVMLFTAGFAFRRKITTVGLYAAIGITFILGVLNATYLLNQGLDKINAAIAVESGWGKQVLRVSTFSDRLRGWERLSRASSWSLFGTGENSTGADQSAKYGEDYNHDLVNKILIGYGAVPLFAGLIFAMVMLYTLHKVTFRTTDPQLRKDGAFILGCIVPVLILSSIAGDNFTTTPINLQIWTVFAGIFILRRVIEENRLLVQAAPSAQDAVIPAMGPARPTRFSRIADRA